MKDHPEESFRIVAQETGLDIKDVKRMYPWYDYDPGIRPSDMQDLAATQTFLLESGMLAKPTDINSLVADMSR